MSRKLNTSGQMILTAVLALAVIFPDWIFNAGVLPSLLPAAHADSMTDAAGQGTDFANTLSGNVQTETSSWTTSMMPSTCANATAPQGSAFPTSCVPQLQPDQRSTYEANYANPGAMGGAKDPTGIMSQCYSNPGSPARQARNNTAIDEINGVAKDTGYTLITAGYSGLVAGYSTAIAGFTGGLSTGVGSVTATVGSQTILAGSYNFAAGATGHSAAFVTGLNPSLAADNPNPC